MSKRTAIHCILSLVMIAYMVGALCYTSAAAASDSLKGLDINIISQNARSFVAVDDIDRELGGLSASIHTIRRDSFDSRAVEQCLLALDKIESANCAILNNGRVALDVVPMIPVARVIDPIGTDYYINRAGKRMVADYRYRMDVPVIKGRFTERNPATGLLPLIHYVNSDPALAEFITAYDLTPSGDIIMVPAIKGHVVNFGDTTDIEDKFKRLNVFYHNVLPVKGWEAYDTISVKWRGQIVAHRAGYRKAAPEIAVEEFDAIDDEGTMLTSLNQQQPDQTSNQDNN